MKVTVKINGELNDILSDKKHIIFIAKRRYTEKLYKKHNKNIDNNIQEIYNNMFCVYRGYFYFDSSVNTYLLAIINDNNEYNGLCVERHIPGYTENEIEIFDNINDAYDFCNKLNIEYIEYHINKYTESCNDEINKITEKYNSKIQKLKSLLNRYKNSLKKLRNI